MAGLAAALPCVWVLGRLIESHVFAVGATDGPTIAAAVAVLVVVSLGAAMLPAWRAASVSPGGDPPKTANAPEWRGSTASA